MASTKLTLSNNRFEQTSGDTLNLSGNTYVFGNFENGGNNNFINGNAFVTKNFVMNATGTTLINEITTSTYVISNIDKSYYLYVINTGTTNIYIPDNVNSGLTFTTIRASNAGLVNHIATGTSVFNTTSDTYDIQVENGASTWQYRGNSEWYGYGSLGSPLTGGSSSITANNGLIKNGNNIGLGGTLTGTTFIDGNNHQLAIINADSISLVGNTSFSIADGNNNGIDFDTNGIAIGNSLLPLLLYSMSGSSMKLDNNGIYISTMTTGATGITLTANTIIFNSGSEKMRVASSGVQLILGSDSVNDLYSRGSNGYLQRIAAGTGSTVLMMNSGGTAHIYSKINSNNIAANAVTTNAINNSAVTIAKLANSAGGTRIIGRSANSAGVYGEIAATTDGQSLRRVGGVLGFGNCSTVSFTVGTLPSAATAGQIIYVSDESGGAVLAFSDGTNWRRVTDRAIVT